MNTKNRVIGRDDGSRIDIFHSNLFPILLYVYRLYMHVTVIIHVNSHMPHLGMALTYYILQTLTIFFFFKTFISRAFPKGCGGPSLR